MKKGIVIKLVQPDKVIKSGEVAAMMIPAKLSNLTILPGRAPSMVVLTNGLIHLYDDSFNVTERYFIKEGYADIAEDKCMVLSELIINRKDISVEIAETRLNQIIEESNKDFNLDIVHTEERHNNDEDGSGHHESDNAEELAEHYDEIEEFNKRDEILSSVSVDIDFYNMVINDLKSFK